MNPSAEQLLKQLREQVDLYKRKEQQGDWVGAADQLEPAYETLNLLLQRLLHEDEEFFLFTQEEATQLELLTRHVSGETKDSSGYQKLRSAIMRHDQWKFLGGSDD